MNKCLLLNGKEHEIVDVNLDEMFISDYFKVKGLDELGYHTFGNGYTAWWQTRVKERTSMEITVYAEATHPIFINSKVLITNEDVVTEKNIDIDMEELKKYFNTNGTFWALIRNY